MDHRAISVYVDQSRWVQLLRAQQGDQRARAGTLDALTALKDGVASGRVRVPLSGAHYHETWHQHDWHRRHSLAALMRDISRWQTIAPIQVVTGLEIAALLAEEFGHPSPDTCEIFGVGVNHAFDSTSGRLLLVEEVPAMLYPTPSKEDMPEEWMSLQADPERWEWANLAGPPENFPLAGLPADVEFDTRPEHARGDDWARGELELREGLAAAGLSHKLHDALIAEDVNAILPTLNGMALDHGIDPHRLLELSPDGLRRFHRALSSRSLLVSLAYFRLSETQYVPNQHDRLDLLPHAVALAYCDVVVTERRMTDLARRARVRELHGTEVIHNLDELPGALEKALARG
jgi:hypothetical protein